MLYYWTKTIDKHLLNNQTVAHEINFWNVHTKNKTEAFCSVARISSKL